MIGNSDMIDVPRDENVKEKVDEEVILPLKEALINAKAHFVGLPATQHLKIRVI